MNNKVTASLNRIAAVTLLLLFALALMSYGASSVHAQQQQQQVRVGAGLVAGTMNSNPYLRVFKGIPFAAPPVGNLRWRAPQPVAAWRGARQATTFGARCMQGPIYSDMIFRDEGAREDCLYLNVWTPAHTAKEKLPVMVWIYGGGFQAGAASEPRQDGERLAQKGVVVVSFNYRLGAFGFLAHPELSRESGHGASGNYGLMDQAAALRWVQKNIAAFGGDSQKVTIFGESAGSFSVSALMASPIAQGLFQRAVGESGAYFAAGNGTLAQQSLAETEQTGAKFATSLGANSLAELRAKPADQVLQAALVNRALRFAPNIDGYFLPTDPYSIYTQGKQSHIPLLAGWNAGEGRAFVTLAKNKPTVHSFTEQARAAYGASGDELLKYYPAATDEMALESAVALAGDNFIGYVTWKWLEMQSATGNAATYRYSFDRVPPFAPVTRADGVIVTAKEMGARHAGEIEYVFGALKSLNAPLQEEDWKLSDVVMTYWTNFAKTGDPNGANLPRWPRYDKQSSYQVMHLDRDVRALPDAQRGRYEFLDRQAAKFRSRSE